MHFTKVHHTIYIITGMMSSEHAFMKFMQLKGDQVACRDDFSQRKMLTNQTHWHLDITIFIYVCLILSIHFMWLWMSFLAAAWNVHVYSHSNKWSLDVNNYMFVSWMSVGLVCSMWSGNACCWDSIHRYIV